MIFKLHGQLSCAANIGCGFGKTPETIFTTLHFLHKLQMGSISYSYITLGWKMFARDKHSSLVGPFISYTINHHSNDSKGAYDSHSDNFRVAIYVPREHL